MQLKYKCSICGELHKNLERHINENHKPKRFTCLICNKPTNFLKPHLNNEHNISEKDYYDNYILNNEIPKCLYCKNEAIFKNLKEGYFATCKNCRGKHCINGVIISLKKKYNIPDNTEIINVSQIKEIQDIIQKNNVENYGVKNTFLIKDKDGVEKRIKTWQKNLKCDYPTQNEEVLKKRILTCQEKYGCDNVMQNHEIRLTNQSKVSYNGINFDSQMEVDFYKKLVELNIQFIYQPDITFVYYDSLNKKRTYEPDFLIGKTLYEIKGLHFFLNGDKTQRMINPFGRKDNPEIVKYRDDIMEAKHQCMIENNVKIITDLNEINYEDLK